MADNNILQVRTINKVYDFISGLRFVDKEVDILKDVKSIDSQLINFKFIISQRMLVELEEKYSDKLSKYGYYNLKIKNITCHPVEKLKRNLNALKSWLVRIVALETCEEITKSVLTNKLKDIVKKHTGNNGIEVTEQIQLLKNLLDDFDDELLRKLTENSN